MQPIQLRGSPSWQTNFKYLTDKYTDACTDSAVAKLKRRASIATRLARIMQTCLCALAAVLTIEGAVGGGNAPELSDKLLAANADAAILAALSRPPHARAAASGRAAAAAAGDARV